MAGESYYATGTVSVGSGSTTVTGSGTAWVANGVQAGDYFAANGLTARIAAVNSNTSITLARGWPGTALSAGDYEIRFTPGASRVTAALNTLIGLLGNGILQSLAGLSAAADRLPYFTGAGSLGLTPITNWARALLDDPDSTTARVTIGAHNADNLIAGTVADARLPGRIQASASNISDYNQVIENGLYRSASAVNGPAGFLSNAFGLLRVERWSASVTQTVWHLSSSTSGNTLAYRRQGDTSTGTWTPWYKVMISQEEMDARYLRRDASATPSVDNAYTLGASGARFSALWSATGTIQTSDSRDKVVDGTIDPSVAGGIIDAVEPILYRWEVGGQNVERTQHPDGTVTETVTPYPGERLHAGFFAQDIKAALDAEGVDFGAWGLEDKLDPDSRQFIRPDELIPLLWTELRALRARVATLEASGS
ncbi:tail fiber domain-containing protein [Jiella marina]|uniref:hypothetical protein n=1 Tax=Jiella sp. LLJ827 TaxID=2917712 RepID=UPI0021010CDE|nr:hypothetical protein [Jiella sp. LLJ827]MCQ0987557.1 hypothetical protein [Jiella sp. LLJ827]